MRSILGKTKDIFIKHDNCIVFIMMCLLTLGITLNVNIESSDELWNFQNIYKMYNGFTIYSDANVICTPLFFYIGKILFNLFGANFFVFRIYNMIIVSTMFLFSYKILKILKFSKKVAILINLLIILTSNYTLILVQANYNVLALLFSLIGIHLNLQKNEINNTKISLVFIQSIITFAIFMTKQNIGILYLIGYIVYIIIQKTIIREKIKEITVYILTNLTLIAVFCVFLYWQNNLYNLINYAILGIREFTIENMNLSIDVIIITLIILITNFVFSIFLFKTKNIKEEEKNNIYILDIFSTMMSGFIIPIANRAHFFIGIFIAIITSIYLIKLIVNIKKKIRIVSYIIELATIGIVWTMLLISIINLFNWYKNVKSMNYDYKNPFFGGISNKQQEEEIEKVDKFILSQEDDVIILSHRAALYMVPLGKNNGKFDLAFKGNLGKDGEEGLIADLKARKYIILIEKNPQDMNYQESNLVREYITKNYNNIGEIENLLIYKNY